MKIIRIKSTGLAIVSTFFALIGAVGYCAAKDKNAQTASLILGFSSAATGIVCVNKSRMDERDVNEKAEKFAERLNNEKEQISKKLQAYFEDNNHLQMETSKIKNDYDSLAGILAQTKLERDSLRASLDRCNDAMKQKERSIIELENSKDKRFQEYLSEFLIRLVDKLFDQCNNYYPRIEREIRGLLEDGNFENIHPQLQVFLARSLEQCQYHLEVIGELKTYDITHVKTVLDASLVGQELMRQYQQIVDEICSLRVRYRNLLNIDERLALKDWEDMKPYLMKKPDALKAVREQASFDKGILDELRARVEQQGKSISEDMAAMIHDLEKANERVAELSAPINWKFNLNHATRTGNFIIAYAQTLKIHLDRSHYTGDAYEVDLYFFTDRINAAATIDIKALNDEGDRLAQLTHCLEPIKFTYEYETRLLVAHAVLQRRVTEKKQPTDPATAAKQFIKPYESLLPFIKNAYHVGLWSSTGGGKTTTLSNIIGGMIQELGGHPTIRLTVPKIDVDTQKIFPDVHWLGIAESIFGLLEAALEVQYRIRVNEMAFRAKEIIQDFKPILFFIDEINLIFTRWGSINEEDLEDVLARFERTLTGERLSYFRETMRIELSNYKNQFAKKLLLFIWQTGRSLRVKSLIAGQNLQPSSFGLRINDLANCSYISIGDSIKPCTKYKVKDSELDLITSQRELLEKALQTEPNLQYTALYCPSVGKPYFGILPPPNYYQWDANVITLQLPSTIQLTQSTAQPQNELKMAETHIVQEVDCGLGQNQPESTNQTSVDFSYSKGCKVFERSGLLPGKYQNLDFKGYSDLLASLPKKADGTVHKVQAYEIVFQVRKSDSRKLYSAFIDWLEANFK